MINWIEQILDKVKDLYIKYGIKSVTMDDIARELGISKKTLYQCVSDKEDLVRKVVETEMILVEEKIMEILAQNLNAVETALEVSKLSHGMMNKYTPSAEYDLKKYYPLIYNEMKNRRHANMYNVMINNLRKGKAEGVFRPELKEEIIAKLQILRIESITSDFFVDFQQFSKEDIFNEIFIYHLRGICNDKGLKILQEKLTN